MKIIRTIEELRTVVRQRRRKGQTIGFVPTMGYFHEGHLSLMRQARKEHECVVVSVFVNPLQFGPQEDYDSYPRNMKRDEALARSVPVDYIFYPQARMLYPHGDMDTFVVSKLDGILCGASRPGHFTGVATVVAKLFNCVMPDEAYFGAKDYQQCLIIEHMVRDLNIPVTITRCPIVREKDGLAMSSRNVRLSQDERTRALSLSQALTSGSAMIRTRKYSKKAVLSTLKKILSPVDKIDYIEIRDAKTLRDVTVLRGSLVIAIAAYVGKTRLIDNRCVTI